MNCFKPFHLLMAWLSPLPFVVPALALLMLLVLSEELARFLYDTFSPLWVPSFFVLGGLNIALFTLRYDFPQADCSRAGRECEDIEQVPADRHGEP